MPMMSSTSISSEQETFMLTCLQQFRPMVLRLTRDMDLDTEDAMQEAALIILQTLPNMPAQHTNPIAYMYTVVRNQMIARYHQARRTALPVISLDKPMYDEGEITLADLLPSPTIVDEHARERALHQALHRLPAEEQSHLKCVYGLYTFTPRYPSGRRVRKGRSALSLSIMALRRLRRDEQLRQAILPMNPA